MKILGVHGIGNYRPDETPESASASLSRIWTAGLAAAGGRHDVTVAYYSDLLRVRGRQGDDSDLGDLTAVEEEFLRCLLEGQPLELPGVPQGRLTAWLRAMISTLASSRACSERFVEWLLVRFAKEAVAYLSPGGARDAVQERLRAALQRHQPEVVLAHSLGTVATYEILHESAGPSVPLWITLGSPLAFPKAVFERLTPAPREGRGTRPHRVGRWANLADPGDLVAVPIGGVSRCFAGVDSDDHDVIHAWDFHKAGNYLKSRRLARLLG
ncbi:MULTISPECIES: serine peptidase [Amycolatopsis]|uniref:Serine peptidase n=1 Tax=Amycolatopsis dendrobii TaxID=2760662 RepID=A0A7W3VRA7_9PSEU|nr:MULTISPECIES: serine peptidase [Amycolatopsis]MBB1151734.1 serine peptidase [Amycolatopsis dendrobii]UKD58053.1 serine peptidase [Amycolatopsis sp. FU40]